MRGGDTGSGRRLVGWMLVTLLLLETAWLAYPWVRGRVLSLEDTPAARGERLAVALGCFSCHGSGGNGGTRNPTMPDTGGGQAWRLLGDETAVPAFTEQTQMMYVKTTDDLREYILDGAPRRKREDADYRAKMEAAALRMPAYRPFVTARQVEDLVAYLRASSGQIIPEEKLALRGADLAREFACFACHGPLGAGGVSNPGSFKGYIPSFWGADFDELVRDDDELRRWIAEGELKRISEHPIGGWFFRRQAIKMPAYGRFLPNEDLDALVSYVRWIHAGSFQPLTQTASPGDHH